MDDYNKRTLEAYDNDPSHYEATTAQMILKPELKTLIELLPDKYGTILDAGCAYGRDMAVLHDEYGMDVVGIDMSTALLKRGKELHPKFEFKKMDVRQLDFQDETFAGIWCNAVLLHLKDDDIQKALQEFHRVLKPGGALCISFKEGIGAEKIVEKFSSNGARYYNYQTIDEAENLLTKAGFRVKKCYLLNERERFGDDKRDLNWIYCFGVKTR